MTENIFLSYRRDDSRGYTNAIYTMLEYHFDSDQIFMDVDTLVPGSNFVQCLQDAVEACDIFLAIIGLRWENIEDKKGVRRLENPEDFVRIEIAHALKRGIPVIPILVDGAEMPFSENLPDNLKELALHHAFSIGDHMRSDMQRLIKALEKTFERLERERVEQEQKEAELLARAQAEEERKAQEKAEADRIAQEQTEAERNAQEKAEADRIAKEQAEADRIAKEKAEADRIAKEQAEADRIAKEQAEAEQKAKEKAEADKKAAEEKERLVLQKAEEEREKQEKADAEKKSKAEAEADFKAKKEANQKARALAAVEKKEANDKKHLSRRKTKIAGAGKEEKSISPSPSLLNKIPVWVWPAAGVIIIAIGYGIFGGFRPTSLEETRETGVSLAVPAITNTPINEAISSTLTPIIGGLELSNLMDGAVMVYVPSGEFIMGSDNGESDEVPMHTVFLDGFWIYKTEVTNDLYRFCVEEGTCTMRESQAGSFNDESLKDHPVVNLSWWQADNYCRWAGGDLPTEAEWEKAARGPDGRTYPWGEGIDISLANYDGNNGGTSPVGSYPEGASPYGLLDMAGNVGEFVADWYSTGYYEFSPSANPAGPEIGFERVWRGGSWNSSKDNLRVIERSPKSPEDDGYDFLGFRCVGSSDLSSSTLEEPITPTISPTPTPGVVSARTSSKDGMVQVYIPAGEFLMGSSSGDDDEKPVHSVYLDAYWMDEHEVTVSQFQQFLGEEDYSANFCGSRDNHPAACVDWYDAQAYCEWRGDRLPTEAEWEKAARGDLEGKRYPWGDEYPVCETGAENGAQFQGCNGETAPVKTFASNGYDLYDMAGNVWEWAADWYDVYPGGDPGASDNFGQDYHVLRGGSWGSSGGNLRAALRRWDIPVYRGSSIVFGFRCASEASP